MATLKSADDCGWISCIMLAGFISRGDAWQQKQYLMTPVEAAARLQGRRQRLLLLPLLLKLHDWLLQQSSTLHHQAA